MHQCKRYGCEKPTWNGCADEFCSRSCQKESLRAKARGAAEAHGTADARGQPPPGALDAKPKALEYQPARAMDPTPMAFEYNGRDVGVVAFYFPGREDACDMKCGAAFLANFFDLGPDRLEIKGRRFRNAEAAFQALKLWERAGDFEELDGEDAFRKSRLWAHRRDTDYAGLGSNWSAMMAVLKAKFKPGSRMAEGLRNTRGAFLLEHNAREGRDSVWSNNGSGNGMNWLGLQLMLLRKELSGGKGGYDPLMADICTCMGRTDGVPRSTRGKAEWQQMVKAATEAVQKAIGASYSGHPRPQATSIGNSFAHRSPSPSLAYHPGSQQVSVNGHSSVWDPAEGCQLPEPVW